MSDLIQDKAIIAIQTRGASQLFVCPGYVTTLRSDPRNAIEFKSAAEARKYIKAHHPGPVGEGMRVVQVVLLHTVKELHRDPTD